MYKSDFFYDFITYIAASGVGSRGYVVPGDTESVCDFDCILKTNDCGLEVPNNSLIV